MQLMTNKPPTPPRPLQFRLKTLFVMVGTCALLFAVLVLYLTGNGRSDGNNAPDLLEHREKAIVKCVEAFRAELVDLSQTHAELQGVQYFDCSHLGFSFVNNSISPRLHIALGVEDGDVEDMQAVPVGEFDELRDVHALTYLQLECEGNDELKQQIGQLYIKFQADLRISLKEVNASACVHWSQ
jgi:hypothetical protein